MEAQHAKFFDLLGIDFLYEPERFYFNSKTYLPDFKLWLPPGDTVRWVEVKGPMYSKARINAMLLCERVKTLVQIWQGGWGEQTIYNFEWTGERVRVGNSKYLDDGFNHWTRRQLREAYEQAREV